MTKQQRQIDDQLQSKLFRVPLSEALGIKKGVNAVIGSGGKSSLLKSLSLELSQKGSVLLTTSTHILPFSHCENICFSDENVSISDENISILNENALISDENVSTLKEKILLPGEDIHSEEEALKNSKVLLQRKVLSLWNKSKRPILCLGTLEKNGKLSPFPMPFSNLEQMADYVLVEADGSKRLPGKAHGRNEPEIPKESQRTVLVFGASALHKPISEVIHRVEIFQNFFTPTLTPDTLLTKELLLQAFRKENLGDCLFVNQLDCLTKKEAGELLLFLQKGLGKMVCGGSLKEGSAHPELFIL
ncbi:selenium cofactor biosynthesis protein YqeC [Oribacterium sinus]|uniref:Selenium-dependent hydroxylase accessory protein YqeC n=1 Tax=Oribacterium sinus TaxID=237576 RepID=A0A930GX93_9FIRM|nr:selenium cofactor biosynthesis protein YqeC [Oribacterium sinus]MBF1272237.1 putative selenium-dependent hydroxylase accessory protein YqeC [Oribacterium sinus]